MTMTQTQAFHNIAGRVYTGHNAYSDVPLCHKSDDRRIIQHALEHTGRGSEENHDGDNDHDDNVEDVAHECGEKLGSALAGLCLFNHIALT